MHNQLLKHRPHSRWQAVLATLGAIVLITVCGLTSYFIIVDERAGTDPANGAGAQATAVPRDISSRAADAQPLTVEEVFPGKEVTIVTGQPAYPLLGTQVSADCTVASADDLRATITEAGCNQVVRGTLRSPDGKYLLTGGVFNLVSEDAANKVHDAVKPIVDAKKGRFVGLLAGKGTEPIVRSSTHLGWDVRGHYLVYCVIARTDGKEFAPADPYARQIIYDMIVLHLRNTVLERRAVTTTGSSTTPAGTPSASP